MPVHLAPSTLTRRQFLLRTFLGTSGLLVASGAVAEGQRVGKFTFALISDTHISEDRTLVNKGVNMAAHLKQVLSDILALPERPSCLFHAGDCAYSTGKEGDYSAFAEMIEPLRREGIPLHIGLGNHDNRENFWRLPGVELRGEGPVADKQVAMIQTPRANWFLLDSLETTNATPGLLGKNQLDWLVNALDANQRKPALVLVHHNPGISGNMGLKDTVALFEVIRPRKQVKAYIFGHTHVWNVEQDQSGLHLVNLPAVAYVFDSKQPSGWVKAELLQDGMSLELHCLDETRKEHLQRMDLKWRT